MKHTDAPRNEHRGDKEGLNVILAPHKGAQLVSARPSIRHFGRDFTIRRHDGDENVKKTKQNNNNNNNKNNGFRKQNSNFVRASQVFVHFFAVFARLGRKIA